MGCGSSGLGLSDVVLWVTIPACILSVFVTLTNSSRLVETGRRRTGVGCFLEGGRRYTRYGRERFRVRFGERVVMGAGFILVPFAVYLFVSLSI